MTRSSDKRAAHARSARRVGAKAEQQAESFLVTKGWMILARNHVCRGGELDLVAQDGETIVFVEVRRRRAGGLVGAFESVTPVKQRRVVRAALDWATRAGRLESPMRFDVVSVVPGRDGPRFEHLAAAFDASVLDDAEER